MSDGDVAAFTHLGPTVRDALSERGFSTPTAPQRLAIPPLSAGQNTLVIAPTGSGKTETAMLPSSTTSSTARTARGFGALYVTRFERSTATCSSASSGGVSTRARGRGSPRRYDPVRTREAGRRSAGRPDHDARDAAGDADRRAAAGRTSGRLPRRDRRGPRTRGVETRCPARGRRRATPKSGGEIQRIGLSATVGDPRKSGTSRAADPARYGRSTSGATSTSPSANRRSPRKTSNSQGG